MAEAASLGARLRDLRKAKNLTQRQLAQELGVDFSYLSKIENDRLEHAPSLKVLEQLATILEVDELELLELADKMPPVLRDLAFNSQALQFLRRASKVTSPQVWQSLTDHLEHLAPTSHPNAEDAAPDSGGEKDGC